jgi:hypothetical protein
MLVIRRYESQAESNLLREYNSLTYHFTTGVCRNLHTIATSTWRATNKFVLVGGCPAPVADIPFVSDCIFVIWASCNHTEPLKQLVPVSELMSRTTHLFERSYIASGNVIYIEATFVDEFSLRTPVADLRNADEIAVLVLEEHDRSP